MHFLNVQHIHANQTKPICPREKKGENGERGKKNTTPLVNEYQMPDAEE